MNTLILMVGLPRAGKTQRALELGYPIVSPDGIRLAVHGRYFVHEAEGLVWTLARYMVTALFKAGHQTVILDGCNTKRKRRDQWQSKLWCCKYCVVDTSYDVCRGRATQIEDNNLRNDLMESIDRMRREYEPINVEEGETIKRYII